MTENKGDLISREALKTELEAYRHTRNYKSDEDEAQNSLLDNILEDIDNAPTVKSDAQDFRSEIFRMVNMGVYPEAIIEWVREQM